MSKNIIRNQLQIFDIPTGSTETNVLVTDSDGNITQSSSFITNYVDITTDSSDFIVDGDFSTGTSWGLYNNAVISGGTLILDGATTNSSTLQTIPFNSTINTPYLLTYTIVSNDSDTNLYVGGYTAYKFLDQTELDESVGTHTKIVYRTTADALYNDRFYIFTNGGTSGTTVIDDISLQECYIVNEAVEYPEIIYTIFSGTTIVLGTDQLSSTSQLTFKVADDLTIPVIGQDGELIDGDTEKTLSSYNSMELYPRNSNWWIK